MSKLTDLKHKKNSVVQWYWRLNMCITCVILQLRLQFLSLILKYLIKKVGVTQQLLGGIMMVSEVILLWANRGSAQDRTHTLSCICTHACTDAKTEVCIVLTGWWSGAPVRGLHPEGESQVLPGCRGSGEPAVLPGAHIWGKGRHADSDYCWLWFSATQGCMTLAWDASAQLIGEKSSASFDGVCFLCSYLIHFIFSHTCTCRD